MPAVAVTPPQRLVSVPHPHAAGSSPGTLNDVDGLPDPIVSDGLIRVWDAPGLGITFRTDRARKYLSPEDSGFFD